MTSMTLESAKPSALTDSNTGMGFVKVTRRNDGKFESCRITSEELAGGHNILTSTKWAQRVRLSKNPLRIESLTG